MKTLIVTFVLLWSGLCHASPIDCKVKNESTVVVDMEVPHPNHALVHRPGGETVWLQTSSEFVHKQIPNFGTLKTWVITRESKGTAWISGKATVQPIILGKGKYHLYIAENTETEQENTYFIECYFLIGESKA